MNSAIEQLPQKAGRQAIYMTKEIPLNSEMREELPNSNSFDISTKNLVRIWADLARSGRSKASRRTPLISPPSSITVAAFNTTAVANAAADADDVLGACAGAAAPIDVAGMSDIDVRADRLGDVVPLDPVPRRRTQQRVTLDKRAAFLTITLGLILCVRRCIDVVASLVGLGVPSVPQSLDRQASSNDQVRVSAVVAMAPEDSVSGVTRHYPSLPSTVPLDR